MPGALASAAESRAALLVSPPNSCDTAEGVAAPVGLMPALRSAASIAGNASLNTPFMSVMRNSRNAVR